MASSPMKNKNNGPKPASFDAVSLLNKLRSNGASNLDATDMNMLHSQVAEQSNSNARVQVQNQQLKQRIRELEGARRILEAQIDNLAGENGDLKTINSELHEENERLERCLMESKSTSDNKIADLRKKIAVLSSNKTGGKKPPGKPNYRPQQDRNQSESPPAPRNLYPPDTYASDGYQRQEPVYQYGAHPYSSYGAYSSYQVDRFSEVQLPPPAPQHEPEEQTEPVDVETPKPRGRPSIGGFAGPTFSELMRRSTPAAEEFTQTLRRQSAPSMIPAGYGCKHSSTTNSKTASPPHSSLGGHHDQSIDKNPSSDDHHRGSNHESLVSISEDRHDDHRKSQDGGPDHLGSASLEVLDITADNLEHQEYHPKHVSRKNVSNVLPIIDVDLQNDGRY